jgi:hypothetical protein
LVPFSADERACFANYAYYSMLIRAGVAAEELRDEFGAAAAGAHRILAEFGIDGPMDLLYSPVQQASNAILQRAGSIE